MTEMTSERFKKVLNIARDINNFIAEKEKTQLYNINVIDELHANENAHSRILCKLLQYEDSHSQYRILESLLHYISQLEGKSDFAKIKIQAPTITYETERIDLWVRDTKTKYSIIFENKIKGAIDQDNQLARYILKTINQNFHEDNIFIIYLAADEKKPADYSWRYEEHNYENQFKDRYVNLSFKSHILPWLKEEILPNCIIKEELLISAIKQYIDHLEGLFWMRPSQKKMIMDKKVLTLLGITQPTTEEQIKYVDDLSNDISRIQHMIDEFRFNTVKNTILNESFIPQLRRLAEELRNDGLICYLDNVKLDNVNVSTINWMKRYMKFSFRKEEWNKYEIAFSFERADLCALISGIKPISFDKKEKAPELYELIQNQFKDLYDKNSSDKHTKSEAWPIFKYSKYGNWLTTENIEKIVNGEIIAFIKDRVLFYLRRINDLKL
jgi:hypothetical protein